MHRVLFSSLFFALQPPPGVLISRRAVDRMSLFKGLRLLPPTPDFRIFGFFGKCGFLDFSGGIWGLGGVAIDRKWLWASNGRFSAHFEHSRSIFNDFHNFGHPAVDSVGLTLFPEGPRTLRDCPEGPETL